MDNHLLLLLLYSISSSPGSDVARLFAKRSSKSCAPNDEIARARTQKQRVCAHAYKLRLNMGGSQIKRAKMKHF